jgi:PST family polysaccharide transporter
VVLARILGPEPFGIIAVTWLIINLGALIADFGFGAALVQAPDIDEKDVGFVLTLQLGLGVVLAIVCALAASPVAAFFRKPQLVSVERVLSFQFVLQSFGLTAAALLRRRLDFKSLQAAQTTSYVLGFGVVAIPMAYMRFGVWSLVAGQLVQAASASAIQYWFVRHSWRLYVRPTSQRLSGFGIGVLTTNLSNWAIANLDNLTVGHVFGTFELGLYNRVFTLLSAPVTNIVTTIQSVLFPAYSRASEMSATLRRGFFVSASAVSLSLIPVFLAIAVIPTTVIVGLFGDQWREATPLVVPLAIAMVCHALMALSGPAIWGAGRVWLEFRVQIVVAAAMAASLLVSSRFSLVALTYAVSAVYCVRFFAMTATALRLFGGRWIDFWRATRAGIALGTLTALLVAVSDQLSRVLGAPPPLRLAIAVAVGATTVASTVLLLGARILPPEIRAIATWRRATARAA